MRHGEYHTLSQGVGRLQGLPPADLFDLGHDPALAPQPHGAGLHGGLAGLDQVLPEQAFLGQRRQLRQAEADIDARGMADLVGEAVAQPADE